MKKVVTLALTGIIVVGLLIMGIIEKVAAGFGEKNATIILIVTYSIIAVVLWFMYVKAKKAADKEAEKKKTYDVEEEKPYDNDGLDE